jgi:hypothetical protein
MPEFLTPVITVDPRSTDPTSSRYLRSYLILRTSVGALGVALPFVLVLCDGLWFDGDPFPRNSLSAYYYSGMRDVLVGVICSIGIFLLAYKVAESNLDNTLSSFAGIAAIGIALFPPALPATGTRSSLQEHLGEAVAAQLHFLTAAAFIVALGVLSVLFGVREGKRDAKVGKRSPKFWRIYHYVCAGVIAVALLWMGLTELFEFGPRQALLYGEAVSLLAFGASWFWKGLELDMLRNKPAPAVSPSDSSQTR